MHAICLLRVDQHNIRQVDLLYLSDQYTAKQVAYIFLISAKNEARKETQLNFFESLHLSAVK